MSVAIVAGMPRGAASRLKAFMRKQNVTVRHDWTLDFVNASSECVGLLASQVDALTELAAAAGGAHILMFGVQHREGQEQHDAARLSARIDDHFRVVRLRNDWLRLVPADNGKFLEHVDAVLASEEAWAEHVRPIDTASPLILPEQCFYCSRLHDGIWQRAREFGDPQRMRHLATVLSDFRTRHEEELEAFAGAHRATGGKGYGWRWVDASHRVFAHRGEAHGRHTPGLRDWKYSLRLPDGFHFDVTHLRADAFAFRDREGVEKRVAQGAHCNVDAHGYLRGSLT